MVPKSTCPRCGRIVAVDDTRHRCAIPAGPAGKANSAIRPALRTPVAAANEPEEEFVVNEESDDGFDAILSRLHPRAAELLRRAKDDPFTHQEVSPALREVVEKELTRGERVVYSLRPSADAYFARFRILRGVMAAVLVSLGVLFSAGGIAIGLQLSTKEPFFARAIVYLLFGSFAVFCFGFGLFFCFQRWLWTLFPNRRSLYVVTDRRCMVVRGSSARSYSGKNIERMTRLANVRRAGAGGLAFSSFQSRAWLAGREYYGFLDIEDVAAVEEIVRAAILG
jgi:hypothetical protein